VPNASQDYDAIVVCNGHYSEPRIPDISGMDSFPGLQMHSHNYRDPERFRDLNVLVIGASNSGEDISQEVASVASSVHLAARDWKYSSSTASRSYSNHISISESSSLLPDEQQRLQRVLITKSPVPVELTREGCAVLEDGSRLGPFDAIIYCTGYQYTFPFLRSLDENLGRGAIVQIKDQHVRPLYLDMFPTTAAPGSLAFIGLPWKVVPFPQHELQVQRKLRGR
jgi:thioredoxin reductase